MFADNDLTSKDSLFYRLELLRRIKNGLDFVVIKLSLKITTLVDSFLLVFKLPPGGRDYDKCSKRY